MFLLQHDGDDKSDSDEEYVPYIPLKERKKAQVTKL